MFIKNEINSPALTEGIKAVGIGKKGSKTLDPNLITEIRNEIKNVNPTSILLGAFSAALIIKEPTAEESSILRQITEPLIPSNKNIVHKICSDAPEFIQKVCLRLLNRETLTLDQSEKVGEFLFSDQVGEGARGVIASVLRVRYETAEEYSGLLNAMNQLFPLEWQNTFSSHQNLIQLADPFDGVTRIHSITPLLANYLTRLKYDVLSLTGSSSGPKYGNNLLDLFKKLPAEKMNSFSKINKAPSPLGFYFDQTEASRPLAEWVERRRIIIKRPFLATLERFINPFNARILIASAFHVAYGEKMINIGEQANFPGVIIVRNGMEGSINFALKRNTKVLCSARQDNGTYKRIEMNFNPESILSRIIDIEEKQEKSSLELNIRLIQEYLKKGRTADLWFDNRIKVTCHGIGKAVQWVTNNIN